MTKRFGFTLAEVLITLGIIGVVAAMTIPTLMNQTGQAEFKTGFKKAVSTLNQAITMNVALDSADFSTLTSVSVKDMFLSRMNVISNTTGAITNGEFAATSGNYTLYLNDGMVVSINSASSNCSVAPGASPTKCTMLVDVNGVKKPNILSKATAGGTTARVGDIYVLDFFNQQVLPHDEKARFIMYN